MKMESLRDLFLEQVKDIYDAEHKILKALPKMVKKATSPELKAAFETHLAQTENQVKRLEQVFEHLGEKPKAKTCKAMQGIIAEGDETMHEDAEPEVLDAALIAAAQRVEHYEIAGYGTLHAYARTLKETACAKLIEQTLDEEKETDQLLTKIAETVVNLQAV